MSVIPPRHDCADAKAPLSQERFKVFLDDALKTSGNSLMCKFFARAKAYAISEADALDAWQDSLTRLAIRINDNEATVNEIQPAYILRSALRTASRKRQQSNAVTVNHDDDKETLLKWRWSNGQEVNDAILEALPIALAKLAERDRVLLTMCIVEENPIHQAAGHLGKQPRAVSRHLRLTCERLGRAVIAVMLCQGFDRADLPHVLDLICED